jgi:hypothetical protein
VSTAITSEVLARKTLGEAEDWYRQGVITQEQWEAYTYVWATSAFRFSDYPAWAMVPTDPAVIWIATELRHALKRERVS